MGGPCRASPGASCRRPSGAAGAAPTRRRRCPRSRRRRPGSDRPGRASLRSGSTARQRHSSFGCGAFVEHPPRGLGRAPRSVDRARARFVVHVAKDRVRRFAAARCLDRRDSAAPGILDTWTKTLAPSGPTLWIGDPRTDPRRMHAQGYEGGARRAARSRDRAGGAGGGVGGQPGRLQQRRPARLRRDQLALGDRRRLLRDVHAGGLRVPRDRLLARQERRHGRSPRSSSTSRSRRSCTTRSASPSPSASGDIIGHDGFFLRDYGDPQRRSRSWGCRTRRRVEVVLPVRLLRRLAGDRLGHDARADQVRRLHHLRDRLRRVHLPDRVALGLRRRLAAGRTSACRTSPARPRCT